MNSERLRALRESTAAGARNVDRAIFGEYARLIEAILQEETSGRLDPIAARKMRIMFREQFRDFVDSSGALIRDSTHATINNVTAQWRATTNRLLAAQKVSLDIEWDNVGRETLRILARTREAADFRSLLKYRLNQKVLPQLDSVIDTALARGTSVNMLKAAVAKTLINEDPRLLGILSGSARKQAMEAERLLRTPNFAKSLLWDARRIATSEKNNALREANRVAAEETGIVEAMKWQLSGRHSGLPSSPDKCDTLANQDLHGHGAGYYPPEHWPVAPHPLCGCYQGAVKFLPPDEWSE